MRFLVMTALATVALALPIVAAAVDPPKPPAPPPAQNGAFPSWK